MGELSGRVAIITGGGQGIGREIALAFVAAGASVAVTGRTEATLAETVKLCSEAGAANGAQVLAIPGDVAKEEDCDAMVSRTIEAFGRLDIFVNNAGIAGATKKTTDMSLAEWQEVIDINLTGAWLAGRAAFPVFEAQGSGVLLNISSGAGRGGYAFRSPYSASKWGVISLTQTWATEFGRGGIRVNCICPGAIEGDRIDRVIRARADTVGQSYESVRAAFVSNSALQRMATEVEVARTAVFLCGDASAGITGQTINVDCGSRMN